MDLIIENLWSISTLFVMILAFFFTVYTYLKSKKNLSYSLFYVKPLLSIDENINDDLEIFYKGKKVNNLHNILIEFKNTGNKPIKESDFVKPIKISLNKDSKILASMIMTKPKEIDIKYSSENNSLNIEPLLINGKDRFLVNLIAENYKNNLEVDSRIIGQSKIKNKEINFILSIILVIIGFGMIIGSIYLLLSDNVETYRNLTKTILILFNVTGYIIVVYALYHNSTFFNFMVRSFTLIKNLFKN